MAEMTIGYKVLRINPATTNEDQIADLLNEQVRVGYKIERTVTLADDELLVFLYRDQRQA